jgi:excisionase family DNA binding protein
MTQQLMTVEDVATYLQLNTQTVSRMAARGELPAVKVGRHWRFRKETLDKYLDEEAAKMLTLAGVTA